MDNDEVNFIMNVVKKTKPRKIIEVGTADGDGSTLALANGIHENGFGHLYTWEINELYYNNALSFFKDNFLKQYITFYLGDFLSNDLDTEFFENVDLLLLDGGELTVSLAIFKFLIARVHIDSHFILHDWNSGRGYYVKQYLDSIGWNNFKLVDYLNSPYGIAYIIKVK